MSYGFCDRILKIDLTAGTLAVESPARRFSGNTWEEAHSRCTIS